MAVVLNGVPGNLSALSRTSKGTHTDLQIKDVRSVIGFNPHNLVLMREVQRVYKVRSHGEVEGRAASLKYLVVEHGSIGAWSRRLSDEVRATEAKLRR